VEEDEAKIEEEAEVTPTKVISYKKSAKYTEKFSEPFRKQPVNAKVHSITYSLNIFVTFYNHSTENKLTFLIDTGEDISLL